MTTQEEDLDRPRCGIKSMVERERERGRRDGPPPPPPCLLGEGVVNGNRPPPPPPSRPPAPPLCLLPSPPPLPKLYYMFYLISSDTLSLNCKWCWGWSIFLASYFLVSIFLCVPSWERRGGEGRTEREREGWWGKWSGNIFFLICSFSSFPTSSPPPPSHHLHPHSHVALILTTLSTLLMSRNSV